MPFFNLKRWKSQGDDPLDEKLEIDEELLNKVKSGFKPMFVRNSRANIYYVPRPIYNVKPPAYEARYVLFGITMDFDARFRNMDLSDLHFSTHMNSILSRNTNCTFNDYLKAMSAICKEIEACHLIPITVDSKRLVNLVLSCSQILDTLLLFQEGKLTAEVDPACAFALQDLWMEMLLVQNQVPFSAIQRMYNMAILDKSQCPSLVELCLGFFEQFLAINRRIPLMESAHHLLHLVHHHLVPSSSSSSEPPRPFQLFLRRIKSLFLDFLCKIKSLIFPKPAPRLPTIAASPSKRQLIIEPIPSARRLHSAGIQFRKSDGMGFSNITFHRGVLQIPYIRVDNNTEILLRNLTAWEQCHLTVGAYFTSYSIFMDYIINSAEDVELLNRQGIIEQTLGSEDQVASIFNGLSTNIAFIGGEGDFLPLLCKELNEYCQNRFHVWRAKLMAEYFSSPWTIISIVAGVFLLLLTAAQTFFAAYSCFRPP